MHIPRLTVTKLRFGHIAVVAVLLGSFFSSLQSAMAVNQLTARSATLSSSVASATGVTYTLAFTTGSTATIQSFKALVCDTASGSCTNSGASSAFSALSSTFSSSSLSGSWTVDAGTQYALKATNTGASSTSSGASKNIVFGGVVNPSATNSTFFIRLTTYSDTNYTTAVDSGVVAASTAGQITVTASVDETLTFTLSAATVALGTLTTSTTGSGTTTMTASTNATSGYAINYLAATTLTSGANTITAMAGASSSQGSSQFGFNLKANTVPSVGSNPSGSGSGTPSAGYDTVDSFKFNTSGEQIASASGTTAANTYTLSFIANIASTTKPGSYSTTITFLCTPTF